MFDFYEVTLTSKNTGRSETTVVIAKEVAANKFAEAEAYSYNAYSSVKLLGGQLPDNYPLDDKKILNLTHH